MNIARIILLIIWVNILWVILGNISKIVAVSTPDWIINLLTIIGAVSMYVYFLLREVKK